MHSGPNTCLNESVGIGEKIVKLLTDPAHNKIFKVRVTANVHFRSDEHLAKNERIVASIWVAELVKE